MCQANTHCHAQQRGIKPSAARQSCLAVKHNRRALAETQCQVQVSQPPKLWLMLPLPEQHPGSPEPTLPAGSSLFIFVTLLWCTRSAELSANLCLCDRHMPIQLQSLLVSSICRFSSSSALTGTSFQPHQTHALGRAGSSTELALTASHESIERARKGLTNHLAYSVLLVAVVTT